MIAFDVDSINEEAIKVKIVKVWSFFYRLGFYVSEVEAMGDVEISVTHDNLRFVYSFVRGNRFVLFTNRKSRFRGVTMFLFKAWASFKHLAIVQRRD